MNLGTNASHAMKENGGTLSITTIDSNFESTLFPMIGDIQPGKYVQIIVSDTGVGMTPEVKEHIFEPFFTTKGVNEGTGMGLAVVYGTVRSLGGVVTVESTPGIGTEFKIFLPVINDVEKKDSSAEPVLHGSEHILFVDDEEFISAWAEDALGRLGYKVTALTDSRKALALFSADPFNFDLVILDQTMPKLTGINLAKKLLEIRADVPIFLCTGYSDTVSRESAKQTGITEFLMKPLRKQTLSEVIRRTLDVKK